MEKTLFFRLKDYTSHFLKAQPFQSAAAISYFSLLSIAPLLMILLAVAGYIFGNEAVEGQLLLDMEKYLGKAGADLFQIVIVHASDLRKGALALILGLLLLLFGATSVFYHLQIALNQIWEIDRYSEKRTIFTYFQRNRHPERRAILTYLKRKGLSLAMVFAVGILMAVSLVGSTILSIILDYLKDQGLYDGFAWQMINYFASLITLTLFFALLYKVLPETKIAWKPVWLGASIGAFLFSIGKSLFGFYISHTGMGSSYGAAGSVVVFMIWIYYATIIFLFGSAITRYYSIPKNS